MVSAFILLAQASAATERSPSRGWVTGTLGFTVIVIAIAAMFFWVWTLAACLMSKRPLRQKIGWAAVILLLNVIGAVIYVFGASGAKSTF